MVLPVTVGASPCSRPAFSSSFMTTGTPPVLSRSDMTNRPPGRRSVRYGVTRLRLSKSSMSSGTPAS